MNVLFFAPEYRPNLSNMIRTAEFYGLKKVYLYDRNKLLLPSNNKTSKAEMTHLAKVWTAGAIEYLNLIPLDNILFFLKTYSGRIVGTIADKKATLLNTFTFEANDLLIMGNEKEGLSEEVMKLCHEKIYIPKRGNTNCLNVSTAFGIFLHKMVDDKGLTSTDK